MARDDGGPAFPAVGEVYGVEGDTRWAGGMSLRDYFAGRALTALIETNADQQALDTELAKWSYELADAMLSARGGTE